MFMDLFVRRAWAISLTVLMIAAVPLVAVSGSVTATPANVRLSVPVGPSPLRNPIAASPSLDPAVQRLLDRAREPSAAWDKLTPSVQNEARSGTGTFRVAILTDDVNALGDFLRKNGVPTIVGSVPATRGGPRVVTIDVPTKLLAKVASLDHVYSVAPAVLPVAPDREQTEASALNAAPLGGPAPDLIAAGKGHHVPEAWALGYTGYGVQVSVMDSGTDFGHPDLQGTFARDADPASPYFDWPMAFDPNSMASYLLGGLTFPTAPSSWYVDTTFRSLADPFGNLILPFNGHVYDVSGIPSASGVYHLGLHPDSSLPAFYYGENVAVLVTDSTTPGVYDTVYVDLDDNYAFGDDKAATVASPDSWADVDGNGIADLSGGLIYFIGDGSNPIPYSDVMGARYGLPVPIPGAGDLVAFQIGDALAPGAGDHGTLCASAVVAQNKTGAVLGFAPQAKLISVGNVYAGGFFYDMFTFVGEGYDGVPGTGDEAQVASASFGFSGTFEDGWDFTARWVEYNSLVNPDTTFTVSSGNGGHGFGTVTSPSSSSGVISVGASTSYNAALATFEDAAHSTFGDVQPWSNRGPSTLGTSKPDVVTVGAWASGDGALNQFGGTPPWFVWGGTSLSSPATAGIVALVENAYQNATGGALFNQYAKVLLTGAADDTHYDPQVMGHGLTNALRAVEAASMRDGLAAYHFTASGIAPEWMAGNYRGTAYPSFTNLLSPGTSSTESFAVENHDGAAGKTVAVSDWELRRIGEDAWTIVTKNANESPPDFVRPDYLINLTGLVPAGTNLVKATVSFPLAQMDPDGNYVANSRWRLLLYDWLDYNGDGTYWTDANGNGAVNVGEMNASAGTEIQRFTYGYPTGTNIEGFVHDPLARIHDGLLLGIQHRTVSSLVPSTTLTVTVDYYQALDAPWLSESASSLSLGAGGVSPLDVTVSVPAGQPFGILSGAVVLTDTGSGAETLIPVVAQIAATGTSFTFGGNATSPAFLDNNRVFGGGDWTWRPEAGDWRFFYTDIPDATPVYPGENLLVHTWWSTAPTDIDTLIFGPAADPFSFIGPSVWGPYTLALQGSSLNTNIDAGRWRFNTVTGGPEEWVTAPLSTGLHAIGLHNVLNAGTGPSDLFQGEVGTFSVAPTPWIVTTPNTTGKGSFHANASLDLSGLTVRAFGVSAPVLESNLTITNGGQYTETFDAANAGLIDVAIGESFLQGMDIDLYLFRWTGSTYALVASSTSPTPFEEVRLTMPQSGQYLILVDGFSVPAGTGYFDLAKVIIQGTQLIPTDVPGTGIPAGTNAPFNVTWNFAGTRPGVYFGILFVGPTGAPAVELDAGFLLVDANPPTILSATPADGASIRDSAAHVTATYVDPEISAGIVAATITIDGTDFSAFATFDDTTFDWSLPFAFSDGPHTAVVTIFDGAGFSTSKTWSFTVDTKAPSLAVTSPAYALTRTALTTVSGTTEPGATVTVNGASTIVNATTGRFSHDIVLAEGANNITVVATDAAGNNATDKRSVTLDTTAPTLTVTAPTDGSRVVTNSVEVTGTTDVGAAVSVNGISAPVSSSGGFDVSIVLLDGHHTVTVVATDAAGNQRQVVRSIDVGPSPDTTAPAVTLTSPADGATVDQASVTVSGTVDDAAATVLVNGISVHPAADGSWSVTIALAAGANTISVSAVDAAGNRATPVTRSVTYQSPVPGINQAVTSLGGNLVLGLAIVIVALVALVFVLYANLNRKIGQLGPPKPPEPPGGET
jgi:predicted heme/steroid binding protein